ncbi:MAG TPA: hypothetical protein PK052_06810 [Anaerohalosphaeraceae bacterium]|nr:hypothetical protein [Anaerohalosphaeraceae bacterium]
MDSSADRYRILRQELEALIEQRDELNRQIAELAIRLEAMDYDMGCNEYDRDGA